MQKKYVTILEPGIGEIVEKKSRFIGYVRHVETEEEANIFITEIATVLNIVAISILRKVFEL